MTGNDNSSDPFAMMKPEKSDSFFYIHQPYCHNNNVHMVGDTHIHLMNKDTKQI